MSVDAFKALVAAKGGLARANLFQVDLPVFDGVSSRDLNLLCREVNLPGRQVATIEFPIGTKIEKIAYGSVTDDVSMSFLVLNDYKVKSYFEQWQKLAYDPETYEIGYRSQYARQVQIHQMDKGVSFPVLNRSFGSFSIPSNISNRLPSFGPIDLGQQEFDLDFYLPSRKIYTCTLEKVWPVTIEAIPLNNELDGIVELRVQLSYVRWTSTTY